MRIIINIEYLSIICIILSCTNMVLSKNYNNFKKNIEYNIKEYVKMHKNINYNNYYKKVISEYKLLRNELLCLYNKEFIEIKFQKLFLLYLQQNFKYEENNTKFELNLKSPELYKNSKYNYIRYHKITIPKITDNKNIIKIVGKFLEIYNINYQKNINKIINNIPQECTISELKFKNTLKKLWNIGGLIVYKLNRNININSLHLSYFNNYIDKLIIKLHNSDISSNHKILYPFNYDWYIYTTYYSIVMCYKLYIDYKTKYYIDDIYIQEIFNYIPELNHSKNIVRSGSNAEIINISYIIANIFMSKNTSNIKNFLNDIRYNLKCKYDKSYLIYPDGGFITHQGLVSYNYLLSSLYPNVFFTMIYGNSFETNINIILNSIMKIINFSTQKVNPSIVSRFGIFDEVYNFLFKFYYNIYKLSCLSNNYYINKLYKYLSYDIEENEIIFLESIFVLSAKYKYWNIQLKLNSNFAYGEIDKYNTNCMKQIWLSKILIFDKLNIKQFNNTPLYPGVLFYESEKDHTISFEQINKGTKTYYLQNVLHCYKQFDKFFFAYSKIYSKEYQLSFNELILITPFGIIAGYLNVVKFKSEKLYLCYNSPIYNQQIYADILYKDNYKEITNKDLYYTDFTSDIIYYNLFFRTNIKLLNFSYQSLYILIIFEIDKYIFSIQIYHNNTITLTYS